MSNVFISYAKEDAATARILSDALQRAGFSVWWDRHIPPGKTWDEVIGHSINAADSVLVLWSKISVESRWVREEAERGASRNCLVPILIEQVDPPFGFGRIEAANLSTWHGDENDPDFKGLCDAIRDLVKTAAGKQLPPSPRPLADIPASPKVEPQPHPKVDIAIPKFVWIAAVVVVLAAVGAFFAFQKKPPADPVVPSVLGETPSQAKQTLQAQGFSHIVERHRITSNAPVGTVMEQNPIAGATLPVASEVLLTIATQSTTSLQAPQQESPADGTVFSIYPRSTTLVWRPFKGAQTYSVETTFLSPGQNCSAVSDKNTRTTRVEDTTYTFNFVGAQPGCWRVWATDAKGRESAKSPWWEFIYTR